MSKCETIVAIFGTGRIGTNLGVALVSRSRNSTGLLTRGYKVIYGSRNPQRAKIHCQELIESHNLAADSLSATDHSSAAIDADVVILATPFPATKHVLLTVREKIAGKDKIIIDCTNAWLSGTGAPEGYQSGVEYHKKVMGDEHQWGLFIKSTPWYMIKYGIDGVITDICGDPRAVEMITGMCEHIGLSYNDRGPLTCSGEIEPGKTCCQKPCIYCFICCCICMPRCCWRRSSGLTTKSVAVG
jgi:predicted dinucleotide-binding enzyme